MRRRPLPGSAALTLTVALALGGCAAKAPPQPAFTLQMPAAFRTSVGPASSAAPVEQQWWQAFGDPVLSELVSSALARNGDLAVARARVTEYRARLAQAQANFAPTLSADTAPTRARALSAATGAPYVTNLYQAELQASYEIDVWGRLASLNDAAGASYRAEQTSLDAAALSIAGSVATAYLNLRGLDAQLELTQATLALREQSRELARKQFEVGYTSQLEWLQSQSEYFAAAELVPQLQRSIFEQENALSILTGSVPGAVARGRALADLQAPPVPSGLPSDFLRRRPDIARAELNLLAANASLAATRDQLLPSFKLTAVGGVQATTLTTFLHAPAALWHLSGIIAGPIFDGGRVQALTDTAAAQRDQLAYTYENVVRNALSETDNSLGAIGRLREQALANAARRAIAADTLRIARNRYRNGYASYLEELDAQRTLYSTDVSQLQLKTRILVASVDLYRAMGGGWSAAPR